MKECKRFEKMLVGYLHGELYESDYHALQAHLEKCAGCRAELIAQRETLQLLGETLAEAPAPARLTWRTFPHRQVDLRQNLFSRIWFSPQFKATLATGVLASFFFFISGLFVVFTVLPKAEPEFKAPPPVERPMMKLKKPKVALKKSSQPKPSSRIVAKVKTQPQPEVALPDLMGTGDGLMAGTDASIDFYEKPQVAALSFNAKSAETVGMVGGEGVVADYSSYAKVDAAGSGGGPPAEDFAELDSIAWDIDTRSREEVATLGADFADASTATRSASGVARSTPGSFAYNAQDGAGGMPSGGDRSLSDESVALFGSKDSSGSIDARNQQVVLNGEYSEPKSDVALPKPVAKPVPAPVVADKKTEAAKGDSLLAVAESVEPTPAQTTDVGELNRDADAMDDLFGGESQSSTAAQGSVEIEAKFVEAGEELLKEVERSGTDEVQPLRPRKPAVFNPYVMAAEDAFSTFSIDVDTASYGRARQKLFSGALPDPEEVRTEEFVNSFDYDYRPPAGENIFTVHTEMAPSPFRSRMELLKIGVKGRRIGRDDHRGAVLTLVIDTSGSMSTPERLGMVKQSLTLLLDNLNPEDQVAIVQFGGEARLVRDHTPVANKAALLEAINALQPGGPTQFDKGLELGYQLAMSGFVAGDSNRIIIMSDGVANLGELDPEAILEQVAAFRMKGIYLSVLGFGAGTYDDELLEQLANRGDGTYAFVDTLDEARQLFVDQLAATLHTIASDVKIQVEFNPGRVLRYRQVGYENRQLTKQQFRDDTVDAGEVGSGQSVTALYEVELKPEGLPRDPVATVYVRYRRADNGSIEEISHRVMDTVRVPRFEDAGPRFQLAACVAEFAEHLRRSPYADGTETTDILSRLQPVVVELNLDGQVQELQQLISTAAGLEK